MHTLPPDTKSEAEPGAKLGALVYPTDKDKESVKSKIKSLYGMGGMYGTIPIHIPSNANDWTEFCSAMEGVTAEVRDILNAMNPTSRDDDSIEPSDDENKN